MGAHLTMYSTLTALEFKIFKKEKFVGNKDIITNIYRIQAYDSMIWACLCIGFIDFTWKGKRSYKFIFC